MFTVTKVVVAALTLGAVQALPQSQGYPTPSVTTASASSVSPPAATSSLDLLFDDLFTAPTAIKRFQRLLTQGQTLFTGDVLRKLIVFTFDRNTPPPEGAKGGVAVSANIDSFPILTGLGISTTVGFLAPCGINTPHVHPRATEFLTLVEGSNLEFGYVLENGLVKPGENPEVASYLNQFEGTVFPQGSIHFQFNNNCKNATFVATLNSEDPGTSQIAQNFFALNAGVLKATLGFPATIDASNIEEFRKQIPPNLAQDMENCLAKCKH
jgi:hypothetical protein